MPRTPLAHSLHVLFARADRQDGLTRREVMAGGGAAIGALAASGALRVSPARAAGTRVVVVGAGLAGLTATYRLRQAGVVAELYEASDRLGGRCWTRRDGFAEGQLTERGGEFIDTGHTALRRLARELGIELVDILAAEQSGTEPFFFFDGRAYSAEQAVEDYLAVRPKLRQDVHDAGYPTTYRRSTPRGRVLDRTSVAQYIDQVVPGGHGSPFGQLLDVAYNIEYGADTDQQSSLNLLYLLGYSSPAFDIFGESDERYKVAGGNDRVVGALAAQVGAQVTTGAELTAVARRALGGYDLTFKGVRGTVRADRLVLALPFSMLRSVDLTRSELGALKRTAISELPMGTNAKLAVQFSSRHWRSLGNNGDTYADTGYQNTWEVTRGQPGTAGILMDYTGGSIGLALDGNADALARRFTQQLEPVLPGIAGRYNGRAKLDHWPSYPWTRGSYSYWKVGQYTRFSGVESEIDHECHFCGEHTSQDFQGYMNGGVDTGDRAAAEVLAALK